MVKVTVEVIDQIVTKISDKFVESMKEMVKELTKSFSETVATRIASLESRLTAIESKLSNIPDNQNTAGPADTASLVEVVSTTILELEKQKEEIKTKSLNVIVTGLNVQPKVSDKDMFEQFCENNLTLKPRVVRTRRIGRTGDANVLPKLCVTLDSSESATNIIESARILSMSADFSRVYMNRDLTKSQAEAAYKARCLRRSGTTARRDQLNARKKLNYRESET